MSTIEKAIPNCVHEFLKLQWQVFVQLIALSMIRFKLTLTPDFQFDEKLTGPAEVFWVLVEDVDCERILYQDELFFYSKYAEQEHRLSFKIPLLNT